MKKGFVSGLVLHNRNLKRWLWIASHALQLSAKDITLWEPLPWVHLVLLGALTSGTLSRKHIRSRLQMRTWIHGQWGNFEKAKCRLTTQTALESQNKPVLNKEANIPSRGVCLGSEHRTTESFSFSSQDTHMYHVCTALQNIWAYSPVTWLHLFRKSLVFAWAHENKQILY